jgi:hypothetical protein
MRSSSLSARCFQGNVNQSNYLALMKPTRLALAVALFCVLVTGQSAEPSPSITLEGILEVGQFYGPPDYGGNPHGDRVEHSLFLQLPATPATQLSDSKALAGLGSEAASTYFVQLVVPDRERFEAQKVVGHRVRITGVPFAPLTGHHRTPLLIDVKSLKSVDAWSG